MITKGLKLFAGVGAVGFGIWAMAGSFAFSDGAPAIVSGQTAIIRAVQDGYPSLDTLRRGSAVHRGEAIGTLQLSPTGDNNSNKYMTLLQTRGRVEAIEAEIATLQAQIRDLQGRTEKNRAARIDELNSKLAEANASTGAAQAKEAAANAVLERQQKLYSIGYTVKSTVEAAKSIADATRLDRTAAEKQIATLQLQLSAARDGTFLQDAYNDAAYSQQRADQLRLRVADLQAESQQQNHMLKLLEGDARQINASDRSAASNLSVPILSPASGIVWSVTNSGNTSAPAMRSHVSSTALSSRQMRPFRRANMLLSGMEIAPSSGSKIKSSPGKAPSPGRACRNRTNRRTPFRQQSRRARAIPSTASSSLSTTCRTQRIVPPANSGASLSRARGL